jgi:hypothetical protein
MFAVQGILTYVLSPAEDDADEERLPDNFVGTMEDGVRQGEGKYTWTDGSMYVGAYANGKKHGQGKLTLKDGSTYAGTFVNGQISGRGSMHFKNGAPFALPQLPAL